MEDLLEVTNALSIFLGRRHISTSGFASTATNTAVFCLIFARTASQSALDGKNGLSSSEPCAYCRICQKCEGALRGHLCDSSALLFFLISLRSSA